MRLVHISKTLHYPFEELLNMPEAKRRLLDELVATYDGENEVEFSLEDDVLKHIENMEKNLDLIDNMTKSPDMKGMMKLMSKTDNT